MLVSSRVWGRGLGGREDWSLALEGLVSPILLFGGCVLGAIGVAMSLPRKGLNPQVIGALIASLAGGVLLIGLGFKAGVDKLPNINFYLFSLIALGGALRVISHPRPVYAALYFILTILASSGLYVLLGAEFMAFALVIVYAGAILITYLFVIMLATESPTADQVEALSAYDRYAREPVLASFVGFLLIAGLSVMMARGVSVLPPTSKDAAAQNLNLLPKKIETALRDARLMDADEQIARDEAGEYQLDLYPVSGGPGTVTIAYGEGRTRVLSTNHPDWPKDLKLTNVEGVAFTLLRDHPGSIEIAGVVLLMAMLGAVVLARKKVELDEQAKLAAERRSLGDEFEPQNSPLMGPAVTGGPTIREASAPAHVGGAA